ncbi:hypothetical protein MMB17_18045 [Methylobacterium organophilum]|uniref:(5-formylfuran-3-yl)methyl phosphate synthase n=1 Tax=Methylobacterium organophilum TaxID=410 RepID=UPI001F130BE8|nr:(5-formylfuran-3-yl)methyl phosphate synthase [Methylobacterium organophilum]UMY16571.1 hypothetical protein MMB17_18045 [Methylobacterium organophilum]
MPQRSHPIASPLPAPVRLLVSVRDGAEARLAAAAGADLVDAKDPERGALGGLTPQAVRAIRAGLAPGIVTSAVAGDEGGQERGQACGQACGEDPVAAVAAMAETGVDWVKVAVGAAEGRPLAAMAAAAPGRLIGVLFAEEGLAEEGAAPAQVARLAAAGFAGAMIDTRGKAGRRLGDLLSPAVLTAFVASCRAHRLMSGLAGSLAVADIPALAALRPDYLGFRGGLCREGDRRQGLDAGRVAEAVAALRALARDAAA